jgi:asparagine synthase (glutamine-hydrolysing)
MLEEQWNTTSTLLSTARQQGARLLLSGHWGDEMLVNHSYLIDLFLRRQWGTIRRHVMERRRWNTLVPARFFRRWLYRDLIKSLLPEPLVPVLQKVRTNFVRARLDRPWYSNTFRKQARRRMQAQSPLRKSCATAHATNLYAEVRSTSGLLFMEWNNKVAAMHGLDMAFPFLDRDLISFLMSIPGEMQSWGGIPKAILREATRGILPDSIRWRTGKASFAHLDNAAMEQEYPEATRFFKDDGIAVQYGYVNGSVLKQELGRLKEQFGKLTADATPCLADLLGLELWLQVFLRDNCDSGGAQFHSFTHTATSAGGHV